MNKAQKEKGLIKRIWDNTIFNRFVFWFFLILLVFSCGMLGYKIGFDKARETRITPLGELKPIEDFHFVLDYGITETGITETNAHSDLPRITISMELTVDYWSTLLSLTYEYGKMYFSQNVISLRYCNISLDSNLVIFYENSYVAHLETTDFDWVSINGTLFLYDFFLFERVN